LVRILDFLSKKYLKKSKSDDPAYNFGWTAALSARNDTSVKPYRDYLLSVFDLPEEQLDARFGAEALHSEMNPNWDVSIDLIIGAADKIGIPPEFISLAKENSNAAKLLSVHFKLLSEIEKHGKIIDFNEVARSFTERSSAPEEQLVPGLTQAQVVEILGLSREGRHQYYIEWDVDSHVRFIIEFSLISVSDADDLIKPVVDEYNLVWCNYSHQSREPDSDAKLNLLNMLLGMLDRMKSSGQHPNIMCLGGLLSTEADPDVVAFITNSILERCRYIAVEYDDDFYVEKYLLEAASNGQFVNNGAVFGSVIRTADRRLINHAYKYTDQLDQSAVSNAVYCCATTTSAPVLDFLVDWATHYNTCEQYDCVEIVVDALGHISKRLTTHNLIDGSFKLADLWSEDEEPTSASFHVLFEDYMEKHKSKVYALLGTSEETIDVCVSYPDDELEIYRNTELAQVWRLYAEGYWGEDEYHSGYIEYSVARSTEGMWLLNACSRYECLDEVTPEEVQNGQLTADQQQAIFDHGSLEVAQQFRYNRIVAATSAFEGSMNWRIAGDKLYQAVITAGGKAILHE
jgi:hypothetical protein